MNENRRDANRPGFLSSLLHSSLILTSLDRFTAWIYHLLKNGLFGYIFSGYRASPHSGVIEWIRGGKAAKLLGEFRYGVCRRIESSVIVYGVEWLFRYLLGCRLKVYGTFCASFGLYTTAVSVITSLVRGSFTGLPHTKEMLLSYALILASIPLILSKKTLAEGIVSSQIGRFLLKITGFTEEDVLRTVGDGGHTNVAFLLGILFGVLSYVVSAIYLIALLAGLPILYLILIRPEIGVMGLFFAMPWLPTMVLAAIVIYTTLCAMVKIFRRKRAFRIEPVDITAMAFMAVLFLGGTVSYSPASLKPALLMVCLMLGYFLTITLITTREWLVRCSTAAVISASLVSLYGILRYFTGGGYSSEAWLDSNMFEGIRGRAVATLDNPNMLGEYLVLILPIAAAMLIGRGEGLRRLPAFFCIGAMGACLILTWSRGAWLALIAAALVFLFMWHRRSVWLVLAGIASIPLLPAILPASITQRILSIGNMADSSTSYRVYIWRAAVHMIRDHFLGGIGIGEGAWFRVYPAYAYQGIEVAPHSHNLFLQIWLECGIVGILIFLLFLFLLYQAALTFFRQLSGGALLKNPDISAGLLADNLGGSVGRQNSMRQGRTQLRVSTAGPLCGIVAVLVQAMTDYAWYDYRLFLMFWLVCGLAAAYTRNGRAMLDTPEPTDNTADSSPKEDTHE